MAEAYVYDGSKVTDLDLSKILFGNEGGADVTLSEAFASVPWLYRAIVMRADSVSGMPWSLMRGSEDVSQAEEYKRLTEKLATLLWQTEASLITAGAAYWLLSANRVGANLTPRWVLSDTISPDVDEVKGITGFTRTVGSKTMPIPLDRIVWWWRPSWESEVEPGVAEAVVALRAAGVLLNADRTIEAYFKRGAIKVTLLTVEGNPPKEEMDRLEHWWKRLISGVKRAYESIAIRASVKPTVIGSDLKDTDAGNLTEKKREDIATALGVPQSLLWQSSAYATARHEDQLIFVERTVMPECSRIEEGLNEQLFSREGLTFKFHPEKLAVMQDALLARAQAISQLVGQPALTVEEGRRLLGLENTPPAEASTPEPMPTKSLADDELRTWQRFAMTRYREGKPDKAREFKCQHIPTVRAEAILGALEKAANADEARAAFEWAGYP